MVPVRTEGDEREGSDNKILREKRNAEIIERLGIHEGSVIEMREGGRD